MDEALVLCRSLQFASAMLLFGASLFQSTIAPVGLARALDPSLQQISKAAGFVVLATAIAWLLLSAGEMGEGWADVWNPSAIGSILLDTNFGRVWLWRLGFAIVLLGVLAFSRDNHWPAVALLATLTLGSLGLVGNAVMRAGVLGWLNKLSQITHLLATGFWLGSLVPLVASLRLAGDPNTSANARVALQKFSGLGYVAVVTVVATGVVNTWLVLDEFPMDVSSPYQALLVAKIVLVAIMLAFALTNRYVLVRRFDSAPDAVRLLRWSAIAEIVIGLGAVGLVSAIGILPPT